MFRTNFGTTSISNKKTYFSLGYARSWRWVCDKIVCNCYFYLQMLFSKVLKFQLKKITKVLKFQLKKIGKCILKSTGKFDYWFLKIRWLLRLFKERCRWNYWSHRVTFEFTSNFKRTGHFDLTFLMCNANEGINEMELFFLRHLAYNGR